MICAKHTVGLEIILDAPDGGHNEPCAMKLNNNFCPEELILSEGDRTNLIVPFSQKEIKEVIMGMKENSTPITNGFGVVFFKKFWRL
jgi:sulfur carrier protein ThiS